MIKEEKLKRIVLSRLVEKVDPMAEEKIDEYIQFDQEQQDLCRSLKSGGKKIDEICYRFLIGFTPNTCEFEKCLEILHSVIYFRFTEMVAQEIQQYYENKDNAKPWLKNNKYLQRNTSIDDFVGDYGDSDDFEDLTDEVASNYSIFRNFQRIKYNALVFLIKVLIEELEIEAIFKSQQLEMTNEKYLDLVYITVSRMNLKKASNLYE